MREAGLRTWLDAVGNVHGRVDGKARDAPALILGSHYDTVMDAGKYDGALGIIVAIASVKASILQVGFHFPDSECQIPPHKRIDDFMPSYNVLGFVPKAPRLLNSVSCFTSSMAGYCCRCLPLAEMQRDYPVPASAMWVPCCLLSP